MREGLLSGAKVFGKDVVAAFAARTLPKSILFDKRYFSLWEKRGFHVTSDHFYEPVPSSAELARHNFEVAGDLRGIDFRAQEQLDLLANFHARYQAEYDMFPLHGDPMGSGFYFGNDRFEEVDAEMLYCMVRHYRPKQIIEIGSGFSSRLIGSAVRVNIAEGSAAPRFRIVDPYPDRSVLGRIPAVTEIIGRPVQQLSPPFFDDLEAGDLLFIDSSHVLKAGSDVQFEFLHVLPRLRPGVIIHIHDIFLPADYPSRWLLSNRWFWSEQYLLQAFLSFNDRFRVLWAGHYMHLNNAARLKAAFRSYSTSPDADGRQLPASFWITRVS